MYYRRPVHNLSGVYRPLPTQRYIMMTMGGYWPVIQKLHNGHLGVVTRDGDFHIGERGRLVFVHSPDGGESWSHSTVISGEGSDNRNPAFGVSPNGTLLASFIRQVNYADGVYDTVAMKPTPLYLSRSKGPRADVVQRARKGRGLRRVHCWIALRQDDHAVGRRCYDALPP